MQPSGSLSGKASIATASGLAMRGVANNCAFDRPLKNDCGASSAALRGARFPVYL